MNDQAEKGKDSTVGDSAGESDHDEANESVAGESDGGDEFSFGESTGRVLIQRAKRFIQNRGGGRGGGYA